MACRSRKKDEPLVYNSFEELLAILADERRKNLKRRKAMLTFMGIYLGAIALLMILMTLDHDNPTSMLSSFFSMTGVVAGAFAASQAQRKGIQELAQFEDVRAVPRLLEALEYNDKDMKAVATTLLPTLLPKLRASDGSLLSKEHHNILNRVLKTDLNTVRPRASQLRVAILKALEQVGDESSLPIVEELAEGKGKAAGCPEVKQTANDCLPFLKDRVEHTRQMQTLLRASDGNVTSADVLLRPAASSRANVPADELLRAASTEPEPLVYTVETLASHTDEQILRVS